jgi:hypothetical protein
MVEILLLFPSWLAVDSLIFVRPYRPLLWALLAFHLVHYLPALASSAKSFLICSISDLIEQVVSRLTPENLVVFVVAKDFEGTLDQTEPVYGTQYTTVRFSSDVVQVRVVSDDADDMWCHRNSFCWGSDDLLVMVVVSAK